MKGKIMRLNKNIYEDGLTSDGGFRFYAFVQDAEIGVYCESCRTYGYNKREAIKQANEYFRKFAVVD